MNKALGDPFHDFAYYKLAKCKHAMDKFRSMVKPSGINDAGDFKAIMKSAARNLN